MTDIKQLAYKGWTFRLQLASAKPEHLLLLIHGWTGDENSMWVFARNISANYTLLAPRANYPEPEGGYSWRQMRPGSWGMASLEDLRPSAQTLLAFVDDWSASEGVDNRQISVMGFSQGAALAYTMCLLFPGRVEKLVALSGFLPVNSETLLTTNELSGKPIFVAHGRNDELIPVEQARRAVDLLKRIEANVKYCESDLGHRVSKECLREMEKFLGVF